MDVSQHRFERWQVTGLIFGALLGAMWGMVAHWWAFMFNVPAPTLDPDGVIRAVAFWPFWLTGLIGSALPSFAPLREMWYLPELLGALAGVAAVWSLALRARGSRLAPLLCLAVFSAGCVPALPPAPSAPAAGITAAAMDENVRILPGNDPIDTHRLNQSGPILVSSAQMRMVAGVPTRRPRSDDNRAASDFAASMRIRWGGVFALSLTGLLAGSALAGWDWRRRKPGRWRRRLLAMAPLPGLALYSFVQWMRYW